LPAKSSPRLYFDFRLRFRYFRISPLDEAAISANSRLHETLQPEIDCLIEPIAEMRLISDYAADANAIDFR